MGSTLKDSTAATSADAEALESELSEQAYIAGCEGEPLQRMPEGLSEEAQLNVRTWFSQGVRQREVDAAFAKSTSPRQMQAFDADILLDCNAADSRSLSIFAD